MINFFTLISQMRERKLWWVDVVLYFVISSFIATIAIYLIFAVKVYRLEGQIKENEAALATVGTEEQKEKEKKVFEYQKKINDFLPILKDYKLLSNILAFIEENTLPQVWFSRFSMGGEEADLVLSGESESAEVLAKQIAILEGGEYFDKITVLSSTLGDEGRNTFNLSVSLDPKILFVPKELPEQTQEGAIEETSSAEEQQSTNQQEGTEQDTQQTIPQGQ